MSGLGESFLSDLDAISRLLPFDPKKHRPETVGKNMLATEMSATESAPSGGFFNIPTLWFDTEGNAVELARELAIQRAVMFEEETGKKFPRFKTIKGALAAARKRSKAGGASRRVLAK